MKIRYPAVSGKFYPSEKNEITNLLSKILKAEFPHIKYKLAEKKILGALVPHAGYIYSAYQAVHFFEILKHSQQKFDTFIILNPNHTGYGDDISIDNNDAWESPYGLVEIDIELATQIKFSFNSQAHKYEHSGEVISINVRTFSCNPFFSSSTRSVPPAIILAFSFSFARMFNASSMLATV